MIHNSHIVCYIPRSSFCGYANPDEEMMADSRVDHKATTSGRILPRNFYWSLITFLMYASECSKPMDVYNTSIYNSIKVKWVQYN